MGSFNCTASERLRKWETDVRVVEATVSKITEQVVGWLSRQLLGFMSSHHILGLGTLSPWNQYVICVYNYIYIYLYIYISVRGLKKHPTGNQGFAGVLLSTTRVSHGFPAEIFRRLEACVFSLCGIWAHTTAQNDRLQSSIQVPGNQWSMDWNGGLIAGYREIQYKYVCFF